MKRMNDVRSSMVRVLLALDTIVVDRTMDTEIEIYFPLISAMVGTDDASRTALLTSPWLVSLCSVGLGVRLMGKALSSTLFRFTLCVCLISRDMIPVLVGLCFAVDALAASLINRALLHDPLLGDDLSLWWLGLDVGDRGGLRRMKFISMSF